VPAGIRPKTAGFKYTVFPGCSKRSPFCGLFVRSGSVCASVGQNGQIFAWGAYEGGVELMGAGKVEELGEFEVMIAEHEEV
jgi:hypothetical protein